MSFTEKLTFCQETGLNVSSFIKHAHFTPMHLAGNLLIIGPGPELIDLTAIEIFTPSIESITLVADGFERSRPQKLTEFNHFHPHVKTQLLQNTKYHWLKQKFNSGVFFGAPESFLADHHYQDIPKMLLPGGSFYATCCAHANPQELKLNDNWTMKVFGNDSIRIHPRYPLQSFWCGLVIEPVQH